MPFLILQRHDPALERMGNRRKPLARPDAVQDPIHQGNVRRDTDTFLLGVRLNPWPGHEWGTGFGA
jgi:hypothetical protein